jgi:hypothetical protein
MSDGIFSVPTEGGEFAIETRVSQAQPPQSTTFAVRNGHLYWLDVAGSVWSAPTGGFLSTQLTISTLAPTDSFVPATSLAVDDTSVYWTATAGPPDPSIGPAPDPAKGTVLSVPLTGGPIATLATGYAPTNVAVSAGVVYWSYALPVTDFSGPPSHGPILGMPVAGGAVQTFAEDELGPVWLQPEGTSLYWLSLGGPTGFDSLRVKQPGRTPADSVALTYGPLAGSVLHNGTLYWAVQSKVLASPLP